MKATAESSRARPNRAQSMAGRLPQPPRAAPGAGAGVVTATNSTRCGGGSGEASDLDWEQELGGGLEPGRLGLMPVVQRSGQSSVGKAWEPRCLGSTPALLGKRGLVCGGELGSWVWVY